MINRKYLPVAATAFLFIALFAMGSFQYDGFGTPRVFFNLFTDNAFLAITAIGMTFVILSGGIDLSVGSVIAFSGVLCSVLISQMGWHPLAAFPVVLIFGALLGAFMGSLIHYYKLQPFIVTLAGMFLVRGLAVILSEQSIPIEHDFYDAVNSFGFSLPGRAWVGASTLIFLAVFAGAVIVAHFTRFGGYVYAIGGDRQSAELMAVPIARTTIGIYVTSSTLAALGGIVFSFYTSSGYALAAMGLELDTIAAVVIGGTLLTGGSGYVAGTVAGVLIMGLVQTYISFNGSLNSWWTKIVIGLLVLAFIALQRFLAPSRSGHAS